MFAEIRKAGRVTEILASYVEGAEIVDVLMSLRAGQVEIPDELLRRALDGAPDSARESTKNNQGRNAMFELSIGAMLARQNLKPRLSMNNPDVEFRFENRQILPWSVRGSYPTTEHCLSFQMESVSFANK